MKTIRPSSIVSLHEIVGDHSVVAFNVGPASEIYLVLALEALDYQTEGNGLAIFPKTIPQSPQRYRVICTRDGDIELDVAIDGERFNIHEVQPLANDILLVCGRSKYRGPGDFDRNGRLYGRDGVFIRDFLLGDGIETVQCTQKGEIWTSYFDEGVFGNFDWRDPVGASGLVAWNQEGDKIFEFDPQPPASEITDCYALNVATDEDVWCCYYTDFPLVHLHRKRIAAAWKVPVAGSHAFAISSGHVLFAGDYSNQDCLVLVRLEADEKATRVATFELRDDDDNKIVADRIVGRAGSLYVLSRSHLHVIELGELLKRHARK